MLWSLLLSFSSSRGIGLMSWSARRYESLDNRGSDIVSPVLRIGTPLERRVMKY